MDNNEIHPISQVQRGVVCIPKSVTKSRILQNYEVGASLNFFFFSLHLKIYLNYKVSK